MSRMTTREFIEDGRKPKYEKVDGVDAREETVRLAEMFRGLHQEIARLDQESGSKAHEAGECLISIQSHRWNRSLGFKTFAQFCQHHLEISLRQAYNYIRIAEVLTVDEARIVGYTKASLLAYGDPEKVKPLMDGGKVVDMSKRVLAVAVRKERVVGKQNELEPVQLELIPGTKVNTKVGSGGRAIVKLNGDVGVAVSVNDDGSIQTEVVKVSDALADEPTRLPTNEAIRMLIGEFSRRWKDAHGSRMRQLGRYRIGASKIVRVFGYDMDKVFAVIKWFFENDKYAADRGHPFDLFATTYHFNTGKATQELRRSEHVEREKEAFAKEVREFKERVRAGEV